ncbi:Multidrug resistance protein NorM [Aquicella siphonis]|uniref:Multidrug-efflux transporter n=1 Tax=Aquicella siphonis TaxID=254247 RepID=A0A5E4PL90_9COXI|nr:MATE family efflux transporter [Aquicella siphonis]VVC76996.1 Multidrug resistance protein NorM [Aquicella siphonis]
MPHDNFLHSVRSEIRETFSLSIPLIASQLIYACSGFIGTAMVAHLGQDALAASVLVSMIWMTLTVLFFGILNSISVLVSHQFGAKNYRAISDIMGQAFILGVLLAAVMIILMLGMPIILRYTSQPPAVLALAVQYMHSLIWTIPGLITLIVCEQFLAGVNQAKLVLRISLLVVPIEIPLIYLLIFGKLGLPACGVAGIGYGFATTYSTVAVLLTCYLVKSRYYQSFGILQGCCRIDLTRIMELIRIGLPMGCMHVIEVSTFTFATFWIARFGTTMLAAHQIVMQYLGFAITIVFAMSQAVTVRVGHSVGRQNLTGIRLAIYVGMVLNFICIALVALALNCFPYFFLSLDMDIKNPANALLLRDSAMLLGIGGILMLFDNFRIIGFGALRGLKDTKFPMYASLVSFWIIGLSLAYLFGMVWHFSGKGIWWGLTLGIASGAVIVFIRVQWLLNHVDLAQLMTTGKNMSLASHD